LKKEHRFLLCSVSFATDARTTLQKYGHVVGDSQRRAVATLAAKIERHNVVELVPSPETVPTSL
jgi:hypothetical protein